MSPMKHLVPLGGALLIAAVLTGCGGGGSESAAASAATMQTTQVQETGAPQFQGNTATDGFNWFNFRRQQAGLQLLTRNALLNAAAQGHSDYQKTNDVITHDQTPGAPGFTGTKLEDRLRAAGYRFTESTFAFGEVISATGDTSGFNAAEDLITAIYHRFVIFEPMFTEAGAASATVPSGYTYFTTDFAANGLGRGLGRGAFTTYPVSDQKNIPPNFFSDRETPDPVPDRNEVGFPISIHADITATVAVQSLVVQARGGSPLPTRLLTAATDSPTTRSSAAAIVPLAPLAPQTVYDVQFTGTVDGVAVNRSWSFTTR